MSVVSFDRFRELFAQEFEMPVSEVERSTSLVFDLGFDSFQLFRVAILLEMLAPVDMPESVDIEMLTVGSVYDHYAVQAATVDYR